MSNYDNSIGLQNFLMEIRHRYKNQSPVCNITQKFGINF